MQVLEYADKPDYAMISGIFERTMKRRGVRESDPFDWEKAGSDSTQSEGLGTAVKSTAPQTNKVIITDNVEQQATVDNQENVEPDNRKDPARFAIFRQILQNFMAILMTALITTLMTTLTLSRMTDLELKRRNRRESNQIQKTQEGMVSTYYVH